MGETTKLQREFIELVRDELDLLKKLEDINSNKAYELIDRDINFLLENKIDPKLPEGVIRRLNDLMYEMITLIRDVERDVKWTR